MASKKITYEEISSAKVTDKRNVVISSCSRGGYTIAQQVTVELKRVRLKQSCS